jgi:putative ABC transport system permease protein
MFRNCLAAALRHLARNKLYTAISVLGLSVGMCTAMIASLQIHNLLGQDHFIPGYSRIYLLFTGITPPGHPTLYQPSVGSFVGRQLALNYSEIQATARLSEGSAKFLNGTVEATERYYSADPNIFAVLPLPVVAGNLATALRSPDGVVLTRAMARKYFGRDVPLGETLLLAGRHPLKVNAVIEDLPVNTTHLKAGIFTSAQLLGSRIYSADHLPGNAPGSTLDIGFGINTYVQLAPHTTPLRVLGSLADFPAKIFAKPPNGWSVRFDLVRMDRLNAYPGLNPEFASRLSMIVIVGFGILFIAGVNFVNLLTARAGRRAREVAVRKLAGADRGVLIAQFLGESATYALVAAAVGVALTEWLLPYANAFLNSGATFSYWRDPLLLGSILGATLLFGVVAGAWPALVLTGPHPVRVLKDGIDRSRGGGMSRQTLVTLQFAVLIGLMIAAGVVYLQRRFATQDALRVDGDQILLLHAPCGEALVNRLQTLPGVRGLACSDALLDGPGPFNGHYFGLTTDRTGTQQMLSYMYVTPSLFDVFGIKTIAGRVASGPDAVSYVINETAARRLGFSQSADAVGFRLAGAVSDNPQALQATVSVIGIVPDFLLGSVERKIEAFGYVVTSQHPAFNLISLKLTGRQIPETLAGVDAAWVATGGRGPIDREFLGEHIQALYVAMLREAELFAAFTAVAVFLACLGLLGLAASIAERRTREIGIRKALGADTGNVLRLLLRQFSQPVIWANLIAWPLAAWAMHRWLQGFAYHVELPVWLFPAAAASALIIALLTVSTHSILVARAKPVAALRYE